MQACGAGLVAAAVAALHAAGVLLPEVMALQVSRCYALVNASSRSSAGTGGSQTVVLPAGLLFTGKCSPCHNSPCNLLIDVTYEHAVYVFTVHLLS